MLIPRVIPCLLLRGLGLVKGTRFKDHKYIGDPINAVRIFNEKEADELIFLDITATPEGRTPPLDLIEKIADECFMPFGVGGGITRVEQVREILHGGAEKVVVNTGAAENPGLVRAIAERFGSQSVVVSVDVKRTLLGRYVVYTRCGRQSTGRDPVEYARSMEAAGAGELLVNSMDRDGTLEGYDLELVRRVAEAVSIPVIASGGAGRLGHFREALTEGRASAAAAGAMFVFHGPKRAVLIDYPDREDLERLFSGLPRAETRGHV